MSRTPWPMRPYSFPGRYLDQEQGRYGLSGWLDAHPGARFTVECLGLLVILAALYALLFLG